MAEEDDMPPSYSEAMAAIAAQMRQQEASGHPTSGQSVSGECFQDMSQNIVVFPQSGNRPVTSIPSPNIPREPPPPYMDDVIDVSDADVPHPAPPAPTLSIYPLPPTAPSLSDRSTPTAPHLNPIPSREPQELGLSGDDANAPYTRPFLPSTAGADVHGLSIAAGGVNKSVRNIDTNQSLVSSQKKTPVDPKVPEYLFIHQKEYIIGMKGVSPTTTEVKWTPPENAADIYELIYVVAIKPPDCYIWIETSRWFSRKIDWGWDLLLETVHPFVRVFRIRDTVVIGPDSWHFRNRKLPYTIRLRVMAVDGNNRLPSCRKGPWSDDIHLRVLERDTEKSSAEKSAMETKSELFISPKELEALYQIPIPCCVCLDQLKYRLDSNSPVETRVSWEKPANAERFSRLSYTIQILAAPVSVETEQAAALSLPMWENLTETQCPPLRIYKMQKYVSICKRKWNLTAECPSIDLTLRIKAVGFGESGESTEGAWSDEVLVHVDA